MKNLRVAIALALLMTMTACASWFSPYEQPDVNITSFSMASAADGSPGFLIGLQVVNPNSRALPIRGMTYNVEIDGHRVLSGAEPDIPRIAAYSTEEITIRATPDLLGGARLLNEIFTQRRDTMNYTFNAKLDLSGLMPAMTIQEKGEFSLSQQP